MKKEYGSALKEFLKNRDYSNVSKDLKALYGESKSWDSFITEARVYGFKWSQIYFVTEVLDQYNCKPNYNLKWFLLHIQYQYEVGNLRTSLLTIKEDLNQWLIMDKPPFDIDLFLNEIEVILRDYTQLFGVDNQPFILVGDYIYINRIKKYENNFLELLDIRLNTNLIPEFYIESVKNHLEKNMDYPLDSLGLDAVIKALRNNFLIISGGPGTGKTTTVVTIIKALKFVGINNIALAAPTGRAAKRMVESIDVDLNVEAFTLHKLLGIIPNRDRPRYHSGRYLPAEAVIIDEASMVDIHMMYRLFDALSPQTKLILVGDKDQLPSVEAGALLGDFLHRYKDKKHKMNNSITVLEKSHRSTKGIMDVAKVVISGDYKNILEAMKNGHDEVNLRSLPSIDDTVSELYSKYNSNGFGGIFKCPVTEYKSVLHYIEKYFNLYGNFTVLTPSKKGLFGTYSLNARLKKFFNPNFSTFYHGEPIMITKNDYINGLYNGDRGVIFSFNNGLYAFFKEIIGYKVVSISKISDYETSYVGTVHKSQGSEFNNVYIIIPEGSDKLLTREILYTALTRAKDRVTLLAMDNEILTAVKKKIIRESGIREFLLQ